jgi:Inner membrane component of T3SS, cytoplasmic domain
MRSPGTYGPAGPGYDRSLVVVTGPAAGHRIPLVGELRLGRAEQGGDLGGDPALSRHHAVLRDGPDGLTIEDLGSANGTFVNGGRISGIQTIQPGDTVVVGGTSFRLTADSDAAPARLAGPVLPVRGPERAQRATGPELTGWVGAEPSVQPRKAAGPAAPAQLKQGRHQWAGTVSSVNRRADQVGKAAHSSSRQVLAFRLESYNEHGDRSGMITVELRGQELSGDVAVGDRVAAHGRLRRGVLRAKMVQNLSTGGTVRPIGDAGRRLRATVGVILKLCVLAVFIGLMVVFIMVVSHQAKP